MLELENVSGAKTPEGAKIDSLRNTSGVDKDVELSVVIDDVLNGLAHSLTIAHVDAIEADVDAGLLTELTSSLVAELLLNVHDGNTTNTNLSQGLSHVVPEAASATEASQLASEINE
jgi:hypothetical protein